MASSSSSSPPFTELSYLPGFGNHVQTECLEGAVPRGQNTPQKCPYGLVAEQLSGKAFTVPRAHQLRSWLYRIRPCAGHSRFQKLPEEFAPDWFSSFDQEGVVDPNQMRWAPVPLPEEGQEVNLLQGMRSMVGAGSPHSKSGFAAHVYACNRSMPENSAFCNSDGDMLFVPQEGVLLFTTELGRMRVSPGEICVVQRGIRFRVELEKEPSPARGYVCELFESSFRIPDLGPIGANGLANPRDFQTPVAWYEDKEGEYSLLQKFQGSFWEAKYDHSPFDVVGWHGNYAPYKYDLALFNTVNSVSFDHMDPSIFTVLTAPSLEPGVAVMDFVIFPPRWSVHENTFRPPYYHRNTMAEYMGLITGHYEAKEKGFVPGGGSLHSAMTAHGPETAVFLKASEAPQVPEKIGTGALAFMFESMYMMKLSPYADANLQDKEYHECWANFPRQFNPEKKEPGPYQ